MQGLAEILTQVATTGNAETISLSDSKETTKVCRDIKNRISFKKDFWCLQYERQGNEVRIWKETDE